MTALAAACAAAAGVASCVAAGPADVPQAPKLGPIIVQDAVQPPANAYLTVLPEAGFIVPVRVFDPSSPIRCNVFVDFDPRQDNSTFATGVAAMCGTVLPALDGGVTQLMFTIPSTSFPDPNTCHTIQCFVAEAFAFNSNHTPDPNGPGADSVTWQYTPNGPGGCDEFDGSDGAFPDAPIDGLLFAPDGPI